MELIASLNARSAEPGCFTLRNSVSMRAEAVACPFTRALALAHHGEYRAALSRNVFCRYGIS